MIQNAFRRFAGSSLDGGSLSPGTDVERAIEGASRIGGYLWLALTLAAIALYAFV